MTLGDNDTWDFYKASRDEWRWRRMMCAEKTGGFNLVN